MPHVEHLFALAGGCRAEDIVNVCQALPGGAARLCLLKPVLRRFCRPSPLTANGPDQASDLIAALVDAGLLVPASSPSADATEDIALRRLGVPGQRIAADARVVAVVAGPRGSVAFPPCSTPEGALALEGRINWSACRPHPDMEISDALLGAATGASTIHGVELAFEATEHGIHSYVSLHEHLHAYLKSLGYAADDALREETLDPVFGIAADLRVRSMDQDDLLFVSNVAYSVSARTQPRYALGKGETVDAASCSALGEALERNCFSRSAPDAVARLDHPDLACVAPNEILLFSQAQLERHAYWSAQRQDYYLVPSPEQLEQDRWLVAQGVNGGAPTLLPATIIAGGEPRAFADSNGCAVGVSRRAAIKGGLLELVERDAIAIWWYNELVVPAAPLTDMARHARRRLAAEGCELLLLDVSVDTGTPVTVAISHDADGRNIIFGCGSGFSFEQANRQAILELFQFLPIIQQSQVTFGAMTPVQRAWFADASMQAYPFLAPRQDVERMPLPCATPEDLVHRLREIGCPPYFVEMPSRFSAHVVKVIAPGLRHFWPRFAPGRLFRIPVEIGRATHVRSEEELFDVPFFL